MTTALRELPSRFSLPLIGETLSFVKDTAGFLQARADELGPVFQINVFGSPTACFVGPEAFSVVLDDTRVQRAGANPPHVEELFNPEAIPFLDGAKQRRRKKLLMQAFTPQALDAYLPIIQSALEAAADRWAAQKKVSFGPELNSLGFAIAAALFIGADPRQPDPAVEQAFDRFAAGLLSLPVRLPFTPFGKALAARQWLLGKIDAAIADHETTPRADLLSRLLSAQDGEEKLGRDEVRIETFHFFGAYAAVIGGLSFLAQFLGADEKVRARAREEVRRVTPSGPLDLATLRKLEYVQRVCLESRRAQPILPITFFGKVVKDTEVNGVRIPAGHKAIGCIGPTLQDGKTYAQPEKFDPDRWENATEEQKRAWIPHGGGVHTEGHRCAGEALATLMLEAFCAVMLRRFDWKLLSADLSPTKAKLFATPASGLPVELTEL